MVFQGMKAIWRLPNGSWSGIGSIING